MEVPTTGPSLHLIGSRFNYILYLSMDLKKTTCNNKKTPELDALKKR